MRDVSITGIGLTQFGKFPQTSLRAMGSLAIAEALRDAGLRPDEVDLVVHANAVAGLITGQEMTRGQVVTSDTGLAGIPLINVENACAGSSSFWHCWSLTRSSTSSLVLLRTTSVSRDEASDGGAAPRRSHQKPVGRCGNTRPPGRLRGDL